MHVAGGGYRRSDSRSGPSYRGPLADQPLEQLQIAAEAEHPGRAAAQHQVAQRHAQAEVLADQPLPIFEIVQHRRTECRPAGCGRMKLHSVAVSVDRNNPALSARKDADQSPDDDTFFQKIFVVQFGWPGRTRPSARCTRSRRSAKAWEFFTSSTTWPGLEAGNNTADMFGGSPSSWPPM